MKKRTFLRTVFFCFAAVIICLTAAANPAAAENLLINGSFEETDRNGFPAGWNRDAYILDEGYTVFSVTEEDAVEGTKAAAIRNIGDNDARFSQKIEVEPERLYRFSGYVRTEQVEGGRGANLSIEGLYAFSESVYDTSDGWQYIEWYGETGEEQDFITLFARLGGYSGESRGTVCFDDLRLEKVDSVPGDAVASKWYVDYQISYYEDDEEDAGSTASPAWPRLIFLVMAYTVFSFLILIRSQNNTSENISHDGGRFQLTLFIGLLTALLLRIILSFFIQGYMVDVNCFLSWGNTMASAGPAGFYPETNFCDYPPAYTYILGLNSWICSLLPGAGEGIQRVVFRFFPSLCDILSCLILNRYFRKNGTGISDRQRVSALLLLAFHPVTVLNSAAWGQMDSVLSLLLLLVAIWALEGKWQLCLPAYMLSVLVKPQALMLGFLGLAAILFSWLREKESRRRIICGLIYSAVVFLAVVVPFSLRQDPFWIINQYAGTLASYPYATVNTANFYYLFHGNWSPIAQTAPAVTGILLACAAIAFGIYFSRRSRTAWKAAWIELSVSCAFAAGFAVFAFLGVSWAVVGTAAMVFAFVIVLSLYFRKGDIRFLPYLGGLLYLILYVFGIKMHERYVFPALLLFAFAFGLQKDRRILIVLLTLTFTAFLNESIVLDNSIRLGSKLGHLNQDTYVLAMILSCINCLLTLYAVYLGLEIALGRTERITAKEYLKSGLPDHLLHWTRKDTRILSAVTAVYALIALTTLGSTKAPQTAWTSSEYTESVTLDLGKEYESFDMLYFCRVSKYDFTVASSPDGKDWQDETWAQMDQGQCWKWKYVCESSQSPDGSRYYQSDRHWFSGRYIRITAHQINLAVCEVIFRDENGNVLPASVLAHEGGDTASSLYSDPAFLLDEQDSFEGLPVYFGSEADSSTGEENPRVAQPSWWNSTYFDEIYHARTAWEFLNGSAPYETSHPPLGKILMSWGVAVFGMTPFGWRFAGALAGIGMLAVIYLIVKQLTKRSLYAAFACGLMALDCMHMTQTQIATIDSFPVLFIMLSYFFMLRFIQTDWKEENRMCILADLGLCGLNMGFSIASKWIGIYAGAGLAILYFLRCFRMVRANGPSSESETAGENHRVSFFVRLCLWCILFFVLVPSAIYLLSYIPYFAYRNITSVSEYLHAVILSQQGMFSYHSTPGLGMDHPFYSPWYEWPIIAKPMFYATKQYIFNEDLSFSIFCFGNPVIWWAAIPAILFCGWAWFRNHEETVFFPERQTTDHTALNTSLVFMLVGLLAQYLPWTLVPRGTYIYHYFASIPFLIVALALAAEQIGLHREGAGRSFCLGMLLLSVASFVVFFPYASGIYAPVNWLELGKALLNIWY